MPRIDPPSAARAIVALVLLLSSLSLAGCQKQEEMPATHPASGKVAYKDGQPVTGGIVQFTSTAPDSVIFVNGEIDENGNFSLHTLKGKTKASGAVEGQYEVTVLPPQTPDHQQIMPVTLPGTYTIKPGENVFPTFKIPRPPKRPGAPPQ